MRRLLTIGGGVFALLAVAFVVFLKPIPVPAFDGTAYLKNGAKYDVRILRDSFGVPHVYGKSDADVAFGLAYAHAEDDFATIQQSLMTSRGRLGLVDVQTPRLVNGLAKAIGLGDLLPAKGADPAITDYLVQLLKVHDRIAAGYETQIAAPTRAVLDGYADGINLYAAQHPDKVVAGFTPAEGHDIAAGFVFFTPLFFGLERHIRDLFEPTRQYEVSTGDGGGSNAMAVAPKRSPDGVTRLLINSHQPYTGPLAWYEARVKSEQGWDMAGGVFPGSPFILHGFGPKLGWANTVNNPDLADVYVLTVNPDNANQYKFDGAWRDFEHGRAEIQLRLAGPLAIRVGRDLLYSVYGPVIQRPHGTYAIRYASHDRINQVDEYYALNKAQSWSDFETALKMQSIPSQNYTYADAAGRIAYVYNAVFPKRDPAYDWQQYLPGDTSRTLWSAYLPFDAAPKVVDPASGFVFNANNSPFTATAAADDLKREAFSPTLGIETRVTNRGLRLAELLSADASITRDDFRAIKLDKIYSKASALAKLIPELIALDFSKDPDAAIMAQAQDLLRRYDLSTDAANRGTALAVMTGLPIVAPTFAGKPAGDKTASLRKAVQTLMTHYGRLDPTWGEFNRFRRGTIDEPANGGPDVLRDFEATLEPGPDGKFEAAKGDTLVYFVEWDKQGKVSAQSIHQFGSATLDASSPHYADQAPIFLREEMKPVWLDEAELRQHLEREYRPGR
ncbi:MAG: acylase [Alphaproteobacteria bacterium]|nr:acylase [Alphaproteobacteria bacterium]